MQSLLLNNYGKSIMQIKKLNIPIHLIHYLLILIAITIGYLPAIDNQFVHWDDQYYVTDNIYILQPTWNHLKILLTKSISLNYHPMTMLSLWINSYIYGASSATPFIITNIVIHGINSILVYHFVLRIFNKKYFIAVFTALIFAIHPMHVESVVWVSERKDVLYTFFLFTSLLAWLSFQNKNSRKTYFLSLLLFLFACFSKAMAVSLVPLLFIIDIFNNKSWWHLKPMMQKIPFIIVAIIIGYIALDIQSGNDFYGIISNTNIDKAVNSTTNWNLYDQMTYAGYGIYFYLKSFFNPTYTSPYHPYSSLLDHSMYHYFFIIPLVIVVIWIISNWIDKMAFIGIGIFLSTIVLVLQWIPVGSAIVADRYTYIPYIGLAMIVGSIIQYLNDKRKSILAFIVFAVLTIPLLALTHTQSNQWQDHTTLFSQAVKRYPDDSKSRLLLATGQWTNGNYKSAIKNLEFAINNLGLYTSDAFEKLANCYDEMGDIQKAIAYYNHSIELNPNNYIARYHRGLCIMNTQPSKAIEDFNIAESSNFEFIIKNIYGPRGVCYGMIGDYNNAIKDLTKAIQIGLDLKTNYQNRAITYEQMGLINEAKKDWEMFEKLE